MIEATDKSLKGPTTALVICLSYVVRHSANVEYTSLPTNKSGRGEGQGGELCSLINGLGKWDNDDEIPAAANEYDHWGAQKAQLFFFGLCARRV